MSVAASRTLSAFGSGIPLDRSPHAYNVDADKFYARVERGRLCDSKKREPTNPAPLVQLLQVYGYLPEMVTPEKAIQG